jgi:hypothetical protein
MNMRKTATSLSLRNNSKVDVQFNQYAPYLLAVSNFGIPLTGSRSMGFAIGFVKG